MEKLNNSTKKEKLQSWIWLFFMLIIFGSISYFIYWFITGISAVLETSKSDFIAENGEENGTRLWLSFSDTVKELKWFVFLVSFAMGIICKIVFSEIYKILINKRNLTIGTSCKGRTTKISEEIFRDSNSEDYIRKDYLSLFKSYCNDDWNRDTPFLDKIEILSYYFSRSNSDKKLYSLFTEIKNIPATEKIKEGLKRIFKEDYETILEMKLGQILMFVADLKSYKEGSSNNPQTPEEFYQWRLKCYQPKTRKYGIKKDTYIKRI